MICYQKKICQNLSFLSLFTEMKLLAKQVSLTRLN
jgi:hypothetical protein